MSSNYFDSRREAGEKLAAELMPHRYENTAIVALNDSAVAVADPIAAALHSTIYVLESKPIKIPDFGNQPIGTLTQEGELVYDSSMLGADTAEYQNAIEGEKLKQMHELNLLVGEVGILHPDYLTDRVVIVVSDGMKEPNQLDALRAIIKPIKIKRLVGAVVVTTVNVVDKMHILCDEIHILNVADNYVSTDHYYNDEKPMDHEAAMALIEQTILKWQ